MEELRDKNGLTEAEFLAAYKPGDYPRPCLTADVLMLAPGKDLSALKILLIRRGGHPFLGSWALPGGFVNPDETTYQAAGRELEEETGLKNVFLDQVYTFSKPGRDPRGWVVSVAYMALTREPALVSGLDDATDAAWFDLEFTDSCIHLSNGNPRDEIRYNLTSETFRNGALCYRNFVPQLASSARLAFDHVEVIIESMKKLREKLMYSNMAFCMAGNEFTLPDLQAIYEILLGRSLYKANFRKMIAGRLERVGTRGKSIVGHRMSELYRLKAGE